MFRWQIRPHKRSADDRSAWSLGARIGYWPCLRAPFIQISIGSRIVEIWHGYADKAAFERGDA